MGFLENNKMKGEERAYWMGAILWASMYGGYTGPGSEILAKLTRDGIPWSLLTGGELSDGNPETGKRYKPADDYPRDSLWIVRGGGDSGYKLRYHLIFQDFTAFRRAIKPALRGDYTGDSYDAWTQKRRDVWSGVIIGATVAATIVVSVVATPAAGAAVATGGSALAGVVKSGGSQESIETAIESGATIAGAAGADPDVVAAVADAAATVTDAMAGEPEAPAEGAEPGERAPPPGWRDVAIGRVRGAGGDAARALRDGAARLASGIAPVRRAGSDLLAGASAFARAHKDEIAAAGAIGTVILVARAVGR